MRRRHHTKAMGSILLVVLVCLALAATSACGSSSGGSTSAPAAAPAAATPSPSPTTIAGSDQPFMVGDVQVQIVFAKLGPRGSFAPTGMTSAKTQLTVEVTAPAGHLAAVGNMEPWVTDQNDVRSKLGAAISYTKPKPPHVDWLLAVAKGEKSFVLHFPSGEAVDLSPLIQ